MSGWGTLANTLSSPPPATEEKVITEAATVPTEPTTSTQFISRFPSIEQEMQSQTGVPDIVPSTVFAGVVGHEGTGKTGIVMDGHMNRYTNGEIMIAADFDNGASACKQAHYNGDDRIKVFSPWVMQMDDRTAYNYLLTYQRVMDIGKYAVEFATRQYEDGYSGPLLKTFLVTAVDQFDSVCINNMKIYDLDMKATDAIEASAAKLNQEIGWNWGIRSTRFKQLTAICQQLNRLGVDVYWETHLKEDKDGKVGFDGWKFAWEKSATSDLFQILWCKSQIMRNKDGAPTGEVRYFVDFFKEKTNSNLKSQERVYFVTKKGEEANWIGLPELRDGEL